MYRFVLYLLSLALGKKLFLCQDVLVLRSVASAWGEKRKQVVSRVRGVCEDVTCPLLHSGVVQVLKAGQGHTNYPFCCPNSPLQSSYIWFAGWHKPDSYRGAQNRLNNSRVKLWHMRLWQVDIFQLTKLSRVESMCVSHFRSWEMVAPKNLNDSTVVTVLFMMASGGEQGGFSWSPLSSLQFWECWAPGCCDCTRQPAA